MSPQTFARCPFCSRHFEVKVPEQLVVIDGRQRNACLECRPPAPPREVETLKTNGSLA